MFFFGKVSGRGTRMYEHCDINGAVYRRAQRPYIDANYFAALVRA